MGRVGLFILRNVSLKIQILPDIRHGIKILSYFRLPAPEPGEVFRILGKRFLAFISFQIYEPTL